MGGTPISAILYMLAASVMGAGGQYLFKAGVDRGGGGWLSFLATPWSWAGMACYVAVMAMFTSAFRAGGSVTVLYPIYATTFMWAAIMGAVFFGQPIRAVHVAGMLLLVAGMALMGVGNAGR